MSKNTLHIASHFFMIQSAVLQTRTG